MSTESKLMSQKDYLKKYLSGPSDEKKKKKKKLKKSEGTVRPKVKVIDDDVDLSKLQPIDESALDLYELNEDAPQVVGVVDDRPPELQVLDQYKQGQRWRVLGAPDGDGVSVSEFNRPQQSSSDVEEGYSVKPPSKACSSSKVQWKDIDSSPPRKRQQDSDESPPRKKKQFDSDESPPRKKKQFDSDESPPRKKKQYDSDESPPRKEKQHSSDSHSFQKTAHYDSLQKKKYKNFNESPPGREKKFDSDESPPRKRHQDNYDASHFRRKKHSNSNTSPARKSLNSDSDESPPRKKDISASSRLKQTEKSNRYSNKREHYLDASPSRRKRHESDVSPQSRKKNQGYDISPSRKPSHQRYSEETDSRRMRVEREKDNSVEKKEKMKKTLDGKDAGLQDARKLKQELMDLKKREERAFQKMDDSLSGKGAMAVQRDRKTGLKRDLEREQAEERAKEEKESKNKEKYTRWGKGLKQTENQQERFERDMYEMSKPLARYADDQDLESYLKGQEREGDPMLEYLRKKKKDEAKSNVPLYQGSFPPNRYNIRPGYRWDGVDRSNGYEKKRFEAMNAKKAVEEEAYKWSTSDM